MYAAKEINMKRVLICSDSHSGNKVGLTPPSWWHRCDQGDGFHEQRKALWREFKDMVTAIMPVDVLVLNGDLVDGTQYRSDGLDLTVAQPQLQAEMAADCFDWIVGEPDIFVVSGTEYHVGSANCGDMRVAELLAAEYEHRLFLEVEGVTFDVRHFIGGSSIPHGRATAVMKEKLWNTLWTERQVLPDIDVVVRSHVHTGLIVQTAGDGKAAMTTPGLQGLGGIFGEKKCSGTIDFGITVVDCEDGEAQCWQNATLVSSQKAKVYKL